MMFLSRLVSIIHRDLDKHAAYLTGQKQLLPLGIRSLGLFPKAY